MRGRLGRPQKRRDALAGAFLAKAIYGLETTRQLLDCLETNLQVRCLCGWNRWGKLPHESTFSRAFAEFSASELPQRMHAALIAQTQRDRIIGHVARDSTAMEAREKFPEAKMSTQRVTYFYDLMDSAYDAAAIRQHSLKLGYRPLTDHPKRRRKIGETKVPLRKNSRSCRRVVETETGPKK